MTETPHDVSEPGSTESALVERVETAVDRLAENAGLDADQSTVKYEKYIYLTAEAFGDDDSPITYSWFKWGVSTLAGRGGQTARRPLRAERPAAVALRETATEEIVQVLDSDDHGLPFTEWWDTPQFDFLERFYTEHAPDDLRRLYLTNLAVRRLFEDVLEALWLGRDAVRPETHEEARRLMQALEVEVLSVPYLADAHDEVAAFGRLLKGATAALADTDPEQIETGHTTTFDQLRTCYDETIWPLLAHRMSAETAVGPNAHLVEEWSRARLDDVGSGADEEIDRRRRMCHAVGLRPGHENATAAGPVDDEAFDDLVDEFVAVVDGRAGER